MPIQYLDEKKPASKLVYLEEKPSKPTQAEIDAYIKKHQSRADFEVPGVLESIREGALSNKPLIGQGNNEGSVFTIPNNPESTGVTGGVLNAVNKAASSFTTPSSIAMLLPIEAGPAVAAKLGAAGLSKLANVASLAKPAVLAHFGLEGAKSVVEQSGKLGEKLASDKKVSPHDMAETVADLGVGAAMLGGMAKGAKASIGEAASIKTEAPAKSIDPLSIGGGKLNSTELTPENILSEIGHGDTVSSAELAELEKLSPGISKKAKLDPDSVAAAVVELNRALGEKARLIRAKEAQSRLQEQAVAAAANDAITKEALDKASAMGIVGSAIDKNPLSYLTSAIKPEAKPVQSPTLTALEQKWAHENKPAAQSSLLKMLPADVVQDKVFRASSGMGSPEAPGTLPKPKANPGIVDAVNNTKAGTPLAVANQAANGTATMQVSNVAFEAPKQIEPIVPVQEPAPKAKPAEKPSKITYVDEAKTPVDVVKQEAANIMQAIKDQPSEKAFEIPQKTERIAQDVGLVQRALDAVNNKITTLQAAHQKAANALVSSDMGMDQLDANQNGEGALARHFKQAVDLDNNRYLNARDELRRPLIEATNGKELTEKDMEKINVYAHLRMNEANPDIPNKHLQDSGVSAETIYKVQQEGLTPEQKAYYDAARKVLDEKILPMLTEYAKKEHGVDITPIKEYWPSQIDYSKPGIDRVSDKEIKTQNDSMDLDETLKSMVGDYHGNALSAKPNDSMLKDKVEGARGGINMRANVMDRHIDNAARLVNMGHNLRVIKQVANMPEFAEKYGQEGKRWIDNWIDSVSRNGAPSGDKRIPVVETAMRRLSVGILAARFLSQAKHVSNGAIAVREIGAAPYTKGMADSFTEKGQEFLKKNFREVYERAGGEQAIEDFLNGKSKLDKLGKWAFTLEKAIDQKNAQGAVLGAYMKEMMKLGYDASNYLDAPLNERAQAKAMVVARKVVTSSLKKDAPQAISRGVMGSTTASRALFQFQQTMLKNANYAKHEIIDLGIKKGDYAAAASAAATVIAVTAIASGLSVANEPFEEAVFGYKKREKPGEEGKGVAHKLGDEMAKEAFRQIPVAGPLMTASKGQTGIPIFDTLKRGWIDAKDLGLQKDSETGKPLSKLKAKREAADLATLGASLVPIPGAYTFGNAMKEKYFPIQNN